MTNRPIRRLVMAGVAAAVCAARIAALQDTIHFSDNRPFVRLPMAILANGPYVDVTLNGKGPFSFEVDTGSRTIFARELAEEMGFDPRPAVRSGKPVAVMFGRDLAVTVLTSFTSFQNLWALPGRKVYGDIGYQALKNFVVEFDYEHETFTLYDPAKYRYSGKSQWIPAVLEGDYDPQFEGEFTVPGGPPIRAKFTIDTGAGGTVISVPIVNANRLMDRVTRKMPFPSSKATADGVNGNVYDAVLARITSMRLGAYTLKEPLVALSRDTNTVFATDALGVNLGGNNLRRFKLTIDYPGRRVLLEPNSHFVEPFRADASGMKLSAEGDAFKTIAVHALIAGAPADQAGLQEGDVITAIDDRPSTAYALWQVQDLFTDAGRERRVTFTRAGAARTVVVKLRTLL